MRNWHQRQRHSTISGCARHYLCTENVLSAKCASFCIIFVCVAHKNCECDRCVNKYRIFFLSFEIDRYVQLFSTCQTLKSESKSPVSSVVGTFFPVLSRTGKANMENMFVRHAMHFYIKGKKIIHILSLSLSLTLVCCAFFAAQHFSLRFAKLNRTFSLAWLRCHFYLCHEVNAPRQHLIKCRSISAAFHLFIVEIVQCVHTA